LTAAAEDDAPPEETPGREEELPGPSKCDVELDAPPLLLPLAEARARLDSLLEPPPDFLSFCDMYASKICVPRTWVRKKRNKRQHGQGERGDSTNDGVRRRSTESLGGRRFCHDGAILWEWGGQRTVSERTAESRR